MKCIKQKRFLFFWKRSVIEHNWQISYIKKFMNTSDTFHVIYECTECGAQRTEKFVTHEDLVLKGVPPNELNKITSFIWYTPRSNN